MTRVEYTKKGPGSAKGVCAFEFVKTVGMNGISHQTPEAYVEVRYEEEGIWNQGVAAWIGPANGRWAMFSVEMGACPLHGSKFNVRPVAALETPA